MLKGAENFAKQGNTLCNSDSLTSTTTYHDPPLLHSIASVFGHLVWFQVAISSTASQMHFQDFKVTLFKAEPSRSAQSAAGQLRP